MVGVLFITALPVLANGGFTIEGARAAAERGNTKALYFLAKCYAKGDGVTKDYPRAAAYLRKAAAQGCASAQNDLGAFYARGLGVKQDFADAARWYRAAANKGDVLAQYSLGRAYWLGRGLETNVQAGVKWLKKAANRGQPDAMQFLGQIYLSGGPGLKSDVRQAFHWFLKAAETGRAGALFTLGLLLEEGSDVPRNLDLARNCYLRAAEMADPQAQMRLSELALSVSDAQHNVVEACKWLSLAGRNGDGHANHLLTWMRQNGRVTSEEFEQACRLADDFERAFGTNCHRGQGFDGGSERTPRASSS